MARVVPDETGLGEHDPQEDGDEHLPPRPPEQRERGPAAGQQEQVHRDFGAVVTRPPTEKACPTDRAGQLRVLAPPGCDRPAPRGGGLPRGRCQSARTEAACRPLGPWLTVYSTFWFSSSER
jgi:hypothetical protein